MVLYISEVMALKSILKYGYLGKYFYYIMYKIISRKLRGYQ